MSQMTLPLSFSSAGLLELNNFTVYLHGYENYEYYTYVWMGYFLKKINVIWILKND